MNAAPEADLSIRALKTWDEYLAIEELQRSVWQMPDWRDAVPANLLIAMHKHGGCALGAFDGDRVIGFALSFLALDPPTRQLKHHSHMLAVLPAYQARKLGARLKWAQRDFARAQQIALITWTYDPLLALNARLNLAHLGALARRYTPNAYGEMTDGLNAGLASDRFEVEWWLDSPRVLEHAQGAAQRAEWNVELPRAFDLAFDARDLPRITRVYPLAGAELLVEIPANLAAVKSADPALAREWRAATRDVFQNAFANGYCAIDLVTRVEGTRRRAAYLLTRAR
ncbi:MAG: GNAT family N-acetyltransferase [Chloroflexi bacterium]|nr:GNAT family N-acetyltransferase [Chloroflexota bacterium]